MEIEAFDGWKPPALQSWVGNKINGQFSQQLTDLNQ
jgi:hypothetical protein